MADFDVLIVGGGIAGASLGAEIAGRARTAIIEAESHCGMHATGRSAAFWLESYGGPDVAKLSAASHDFLERPPEDFSERGFLRTRGAVHLTRDELPELPSGVRSRVVERGELEQLVPGIRPQWRRALLEPGCADIDVAALHSAYLRQFRLNGGTVSTDSRASEGCVSAGRVARRAARRIEHFGLHSRQCGGCLGGSGGRGMRSSPARHRAEAADDGAAEGRPLGTSRSAAGR